MAACAAVLVTILTVGAAVVVPRALPSRADSAPVNPADPATPPTVTADALPTTQIDGVAWSQVIVGNRVFVGGRFDNARPAGSPVGVGNVARSKLLAYDLATGVLDASFAPVLNAQVRSVTVSPDRTRLYVGGDFTTVNGQPRNRVAAFDVATGALVATFAPNVGYHVYSVVATDSTVYVGGNFQGVGTSSRSGLAAFRASDAALLDWAPAATGGMVTTMVMAPDRSKLVVGGRFTAVNGSTAPGYGLAAIDAVSGVVLPWAANGLIRNGGNSSGLTSLTSDGVYVYGSSFVYGSGGNHEGVFKARWSDGGIEWLEDCHGDTYGVHVQSGVVYAVGHAHYCGNIGGFWQTNPWSFYRAIAFSAATTGTITREPYGYTNFEGQPSPNLLNWFPQVEMGLFTGQYQAAWSVTGNAQYVVLGGEFPSVNGTAQQGLVRFAVPSIAPKRQVARLFLDGWPLKVNSFVAGEVQLNWSQNWDRDNETLTYRLFREGTAQPIFQTTSASHFWNLQTMGYTDAGLVPGATHRYRVIAVDAFGNEAPSNWTSVGVAADTTSTYAQAVMQDGPIDYWRLGEANGTVGADMIGTRPFTAAAPTFGRPGAIVGDADTAVAFAGSSGSHAGSASLRPAPPTDLTITAWFRTTTSRGGKIVGYGVNQLGNSARTDRHIYMGDDGRLHFGVDPGGGVRTVSSSTAYNDGAWHLVAATLGSDGMRLSVDGVVVGSRLDVTRALEYVGHWRIGGDNLNGWPERPNSDYFSGDIDDVAIYHRVLSLPSIQRQHSIATGGPVPNAAPSAAFVHIVDSATVSVDASPSTDIDGTIVSWSWDFGDDTTASTQTATHVYAAPGTYTISLTVTDDDGATGTSAAPITITIAAPPPPNQPPTAAFTATANGLTVALDGRSSVDADGSITSWTWDAGNATTATGATASVTYGTSGTYTITLLVTDDDGATATTTRSITVTAPLPPTTYAVDTFERAVAGGLGSADQGGAWTISGSAADFSVAGGAARIVLPAAGSGRNVYLTSVSAIDTRLRARISMDEPATGGGVYVSLLGRRVGAADQRAKVRFLGDGSVQLFLGTMNGSESTLASVVVPGLTYAVGESLEVMFEVTGASPTTVRAKVWKTGQAEPAVWTLVATDTTPVLQTAGHVGVATYVSGSAVNAPLTVSIDDLWAGVPA